MMALTDMTANLGALRGGEGTEGGGRRGTVAAAAGRRLRRHPAARRRSPSRRARPTGVPTGKATRQQPPPPRPPRPPRPQRKPWSGAGWPGAVELAAQEAGGSFRTDRVTDKDGNVTETRQMNVNRRRLTTLRVGGQQPQPGARREPGARRGKPAQTIAGTSAEEGTGSSGSVGVRRTGVRGEGRRLRRMRERAPERRTRVDERAVLERRVSIFQFPATVPVHGEQSEKCPISSPANQIHRGFYPAANHVDAFPAHERDVPHVPPLN